MESISVKNLSFSRTTLASSELPRISGKLAKITNLTHLANLTQAISLPKPLNILDKVNFTLERGEVLCISGKSGEGKSSLLRVIAGLEKAGGGGISLFGEPVKNSEWNAISMAQKGMGFVFQTNALLHESTVWQNIAIPLRYHNMGTEEEIEKKVNNALLQMLARKYADEYPDFLSLGMKKRVAIARSLAMDAKILLLDEPTLGLDQSSRNNLLSLINNLREVHKTTIIMVVNDLQIARDLNGKISFLMNRKLTDPMRYEEIKDSDDPRIRAMAN